MRASGGCGIDGVVDGGAALTYGWFAGGEYGVL
jgi:hypothetical protein